MSLCSWRKEIAESLQPGDTTKAVSMARRLSKKQNPDEVAAYLIELGITLGKKKEQHEDALSLFEAASAIAEEKKCKDYANFNAGVALAIIGYSFGERGQLGEAEKRLRKSVELSPNFSLSHQCYGHCLHKLGKKRKAEYHFRQALGIDPKNAKTHALYAILLAELHRFEEAVIHSEQAVELEPSNSDFHALLGMALIEKNDYANAEGEFKKAIDLNPTSLLAHYHYGVLLGEISRWPEAENHFEKVFHADPSFENVKAMYSASILHRHVNSRRQQPITEKWRWARRVYFENERPLDVEEFKLMEQHRKEWRNIYEAFVCEMCGRCCRNTKWAVNPDTRLCWEDIERWRHQERNDILKYVLVFEGLGGDFVASDGKFFSRCPFLRRNGPRKYFCSIHETKPAVCKVAPFYFHPQERCENCGRPVREEDTHCRRCGMFLKADPHMLLTGCPGLRKTLKSLGIYRPFHKLDFFELLSTARTRWNP